MELSMTTKEGLKITHYYRSNRARSPYKIVLEDKDKKLVMDDKNKIKQLKKEMYEVGLRNNGVVALQPIIFEDESLGFEVLDPPVEDEIEEQEEKE